MFDWFKKKKKKSSNIKLEEVSSDHPVHEKYVEGKGFTVFKKNKRKKVLKK